MLSRRCLAQAKIEADSDDDLRGVGVVRCDALVNEIRPVLTK